MRQELEQGLMERFGSLLNLEREKTWTDKYFRCEDGWAIILFDFFKEIEATGEKVRFTCVKEKYGLLRVYPDFDYGHTERFSEVAMLSPKVIGIIHALEQKSYQTCEFCGQPGSIRWEYEWLRALCDGCVATYDSPPRKWPETVRVNVKPNPDYKEFTGYTRL